MKKKDKGRLTGGVTPQGDLKAIHIMTLKQSLRREQKKQYKTLEKI